MKVNPLRSKFAQHTRGRRVILKTLDHTILQCWTTPKNITYLVKVCTTVVGQNTTLCSAMLSDDMGKWKCLNWKRRLSWVHVSITNYISLALDAQFDISLTSTSFEIMQRLDPTWVWCHLGTKKNVVNIILTSIILISTISYS